MLLLLFLSISISSAMRFKSFSRLMNSRLTDISDVSLCVNTSRELSIRPPWNAPHWLWSLAWKMHSTALPLLHAFDQCKMKDTCVNLSVLWWKAISGNRILSSTYDGGFSYDFLPSWTRAIVAFPFCYLYPNLHHQNVAMRTGFLDRALHAELEKATQNSSEQGKTKVVILGGGFDSRTLRFGNNPLYKNVEFFELDLPEVVDQKSRILARFLRRRPNFPKFALPRLLGVDLNDNEKLTEKLKIIFNPSSSKVRSPTIFLSEAVLLYLKPESVGQVLKTCVSIASPYSSTIAYCFADRLVNRGTGEKMTEKEDVAVFLKDTANLHLDVWLPKPGKARHMGVASFK